MFCPAFKQTLENNVHKHHAATGSQLSVCVNTGQADQFTLEKELTHGPRVNISAWQTVSALLRYIVGV